jgi:hypothetical protein
MPPNLVLSGPLTHPPRPFPAPFRGTLAQQNQQIKRFRSDARREAFPDRRPGWRSTSWGPTPGRMPTCWARFCRRAG